MVTSVSGEDVRDITNSTVSISIVLTRARNPIQIIQDVNLSLNVGKAEETTGDDGNDIVPTKNESSTPLSQKNGKENLLIGNTSNGAREVRVNVVNKLLVPNARGTICDKLERRA